MAIEVLHPDETKVDKSPGVMRRFGSSVTAKQEISVLDLLLVIAEHRRTILYVTAVGLELGLLLCVLLPDRYTATVTLLPPQQSSSLSAALSSQLGSLGGMSALAGGSLGLKNANDMFVGMLKSRTVEDSVVKHFNLMQEYHVKYASDARREFESRRSVDGSAKDGLIRISVEDRSPTRASEIANGYVDQFRLLSEHLAITEASQRRLFFEKQIEQAKENLANAEEAMKRTEQATGLIQLDSQARALIESAAALRAQIAVKEVEIKGIQTYATDENAQVIQAERELDSLRAQLAKLGGSEDNSSGELIVPKGNVTSAGLEYVRKVRDVSYYETLFQILARQFELAKLDEARQGALIQVVDPAIPPDRKSSPHRALIVLLSMVGGFALGTVIVLIRAAMANANSDPETRAKFQRLWHMIPRSSANKSKRANAAV